MSDQLLPHAQGPNAYIPDPDLDLDEIVLAAYRDRTVSMLRRYARAAVELGRLPSLLGREFFRARVTSYTVQTFEDAIIFAFDMERCIELLSPFERTILARLALQQYTQDEIARVMRIDRLKVQRRYFDALDHLTEILLEHAMLNATILQPRFGRRPMPDAVVDYRAPAPLPSPTRSPAIPDISESISLKACQDPKIADFAASA